MLFGPFIVKDLCKSNYRPQLVLPLTSPLKSYFVTLQNCLQKNSLYICIYSGNLIVNFVSMSNNKIVGQIKALSIFPEFTASNINYHSKLYHVFPFIVLNNKKRLHVYLELNYLFIHVCVRNFIIR